MNPGRNSRGASMLALTIAFVFFFVILGVGIYSYIFLTGSAKSLQEATDAAAINVAKQAMSGVYADLSLGASPNYFDAAMTPILGTTNLNLYGYNKAVARALMVSLNAVEMQNDDAKAAGVDLTTNGAIAQATALISRLQGSKTSIGGQLQNYLANHVDSSGNDWAQQAFNSIASSPLSSLGIGSGVQYDPKQFAAAYFTGTGETTAIAPVADELPSSTTTPPTSAVSSSDGALIGYGGGITVGGMTMVAVPADPQQAPHLISLSNYSDPAQNWTPSGYFVPPNAFKIGASAIDKQTKAPTYAQAASLVGGLPSVQSANNMFVSLDTGSLLPHIQRLIAYLGAQPAYADASTSGMGATTAGIPGGYMLIDNSNSSTPNSTGSIGVMQNVFSNELGVGISVDDTTSMFSDNGAVQNWQAFPHTPPAAGVAWNPKKDPLVTSSSTIPSVTGLYNPNGSAATLGTAGTIPYADPGGTAPPTSLCTDQNSESADPSSDPQCVTLASPTAGGGLDPFDVAYHPGVTPQTVTPTGSALTAAEVAKVMLISAWQYPLQGCTTVNFSSIYPTGIRLWPGEATPDRQGYPQWPYETGPSFGFAEDEATSGWWDGDSGSGYEGTAYSDPAALGKISHDGTVYKLFHQIDPTDNSYSNFVNVAATRVMQMGAIGMSKSSFPGAPAGTVAYQVDNLFRTASMPLGARMYLYLSTQTDSSTGKQTNVLAMDSNGPGWLTGGTSTQASQALQGDLISNLNNLQGLPASQWNSSNNVTPAGPKTGAVQLDGVWVPTSYSFNAEESIVDPHYEWNIHDQPFTASGNAPAGSETTIAQVTVTETAAYQKTSGAYGLLGVLKFQEQTSGTGTAYYWAPN